MVGFILITGCASIASGARDVPTSSDASVDAAALVDAAADIWTTQPADSVLPVDAQAVDVAPDPCPLPPGGPLRAPPMGPDAIVDIDEDIGLACLLRADGHIRCRGFGNGGVFADGVDAMYRNFQTLTLPGIDDARSFDMSVFVGCAVRGDGTVWCWGDNAMGRVHPDLPPRMLLPTQVPGISGARRVSLGLTTMRPCVLLDGGHVRCWGDGVMPPDDEGHAVDVLSFAGWVCIRYEGDRVRCNQGYTGGVESVVELPEGGATQIASGLTFAAALDRAGNVSWWGAVPPRHGPTPPTPVGVRCATSIALGAEHGCASITDGTARCWDRTGGATSVPGLDRVVRVLRTASSSCALREDGGVWCWGGGWFVSDSDAGAAGALTRVSW